MRKILLTVGVIAVAAILTFVLVLVNQNNTLNAQVATWDAEYASLEKSAAKSEDKLGKTETELETAKADADTAKAQIETITGELEAVKTDADTAKAQIETISGELEAAKTDADTAKAQIETISGELEAAKADADTAKAQIETITGELEAAKADADTAKAQIETITGELEAAKADADTAKTQLETIAGELEAAKADADTAKAQIETITGELETAKTDAATANSELELARAEASANAGIVADLEAAKTAAEQAKADAETKLAELQDKLTELQTQLDELIQKPAPVEAPVASTLTIYHTNDIHSRVDNAVNGGTLGYAKLASVVNAARAEGNVLLLDAGDTLHGLPFSTLQSGASIVRLMNALEYDAMVPGNHDYNYGFARLKELEAEMNFPLVCANVKLLDGTDAFKPYALIERGDKTIAVIGADNILLPSSIHPTKIAEISFEDGKAAVEAIVAQVREQADLVIVLCHYGATEGYTPNSSELAAIQGVDLVIDGHSHTELANVPQVEGSAPVVSSGEYMEFVGKVVVTFEADGTIKIEPIALTAEELSAVEPDAAVQAILDEVNNEQAPLLAAVVGHTDVDLVGEREFVRTQETNLGNLAADALLFAYPEADFAFTNGGGIRKTIPAGDITVRDLVDVFPFGNVVMVKRVSGSALRAAFELSVASYPETKGGFLQVSKGVKIVFDAKAEVGSRLVSFTINGADLDDAKDYVIVTNDFTAMGGDNYVMLGEAELVVEMISLDEAFKNYVQSLDVVAPAVEGRIEAVVSDEEAPAEESTQDAPAV